LPPPRSLPPPVSGAPSRRGQASWRHTPGLWESGVGAEPASARLGSGLQGALVEHHAGSSQARSATLSGTVRFQPATNRSRVRAQSRYRGRRGARARSGLRCFSSTISASRCCSGKKPTRAEVSAEPRARACSITSPRARCARPRTPPAGTRGWTRRSRRIDSLALRRRYHHQRWCFVRALASLPRDSGTIEPPTVSGPVEEIVYGHDLGRAEAACCA
jgi:hypothetical protein